MYILSGSNMALDLPFVRRLLWYIFQFSILFQLLSYFTLPPASGGSEHLVVSSLGTSPSTTTITTTAADIHFNPRHSCGGDPSPHTQEPDSLPLHYNPKVPTVLIITKISTHIISASFHCSGEWNLRPFDRLVSYDKVSWFHGATSIPRCANKSGGSQDALRVSPNIPS